MSVKDLDKEYLYRQAEEKINRILEHCHSTDTRLYDRRNAEWTVWLTTDFSHPGRIVVNSGAGRIKNVEPDRIDDYVIAMP